MVRPASGLMQTLINIDVPDIEAGIAFYRDGIGLQLARRLFAGSVAEMLGAAAPIYLIEKRDGSLPCPDEGLARHYTRHWTPVHLDFAVADIEAAVQRASTAGATIESDAQDFSWGRLATFADPFGHGFCFIEWRGAPYAGMEDNES